jgi:heptosyltransferase I
MSSPLRKILVVRLSSLGDVIQTLTIPTVIRHRYPQAKIGWAIDTELADAISDHPDLDYIHKCDRNRWGRELRNPLRWPGVGSEARRFVAEIRATGYDVALDVQGLLKSAIIPFLAGIKRRIGFGHRRELTNFFYNERYLTSREYFDPRRHHVEHMMVLAAAIGCDTSDVTVRAPDPGADVRDRVRRRLDEAFHNTNPAVALAPATQWPSKRWPPEYWIELGKTILSSTDVNLVLLGGAADAQAIGELEAALDHVNSARVLNLAGRTSIPELYALMGLVSALVAADTAPLHIAAASGCRRLIGLFGSTPALRTGPLGGTHMTLLAADPPMACQPCQLRQCRWGTNECLRRITPAQVFDTLAGGLARTGSHDYS